MAKQLNVDLNVRANTAEAKKSLQDLQKSLTQVANMSMSSTTTGMTQAAQAAKELSVHLNKAVNTDTGKLNLNALNSSLKASKTDLSELSSKLLQAGSSGQAAFVQLAQSIAAADRPLVTMGTHLSGFLTTLKNTARWQISSSILHGFMGSLQSAYGYAQDLNQSLNNIRIVTGQSVDQMAQFAEQANKAAKSLSTTTTAYTDAALIYYQQGLTGKEVTERTDTTIKMANVSRQSAEEVSSQMTAIWNNFADGSKELEYYADVITALGAATASSSDEIAEGLQKFASIADTVGLSYEKATAALATVVAETRQSADVVGTAFKTMFARLQGLSLGETLDDGVDLNKYSSALKTVGVDIIDAKGNLKDMDSILDETAEKWNTISEAQKVALAETVAGVRQYSQFMAIMENYDKILANQDLAAGSSGTLQEQADIYAQSWEAAQKRVKASLQSIYSDLIDDKFFIKLTDGFAKLLSGLDAFIDGIGGLKTLLIGISGFILSSISGKIGPAIDQLRINLTTMFQSPMQQAKEYSERMQGILSAAKNQTGLGSLDNADISTKTAITNAEQLSIAKNKLLQVDSQLTPMEKQLYQTELELIEAQQQENQAYAEKVQNSQNALDKLMDENSNEQALAQTEKQRAEGLQDLKNELQDLWELSAFAETNEDVAYLERELQSKRAAIAEYEEQTNAMVAGQDNFVNALLNGYEALEKQKQGIELTEEEMANFNNGILTISGALDGFADNLAETKECIDEAFTPEDMMSVKAEIQNLSKDLATMNISTKELDKIFDQCFSANEPAKLKASMEQLEAELRNLKVPTEDVEKILNRMGKTNQIKQINSHVKTLKTDMDNLKDSSERLNNAITNFNPSHLMSGVEAFSKLASVAMNTAMVINSVKSAFNALASEDMSPLEKFTTVLMSIGMIVPSTIGIMKGLQTIIQSVSASAAAYTIVMEANAAAERIVQGTAAGYAAVINLKETSLRSATAATLAHIVAEETELTVEQEATLAKELEALATAKGTALTEADVTACVAHTLAKGTEKKAIMGVVAAKLKAIAVELGFLGTTLLVVAAVAALVAIIWGLVKAFQAIQANTPEGKLKAAQEKAEELKTALDEATQAAEDLKSAFDTYDSVKDKLASCTKGTQEWYEALSDVNDQVLDMIAKYPELAKYLETGPNGELRFKEGVEEVEQAYVEDAIKARGASLKADQQVREAQINVDKNNIANTLVSSIGGYGPNGGGGAEVSAATKILTDNADELRGLTGDLLASKIGEILTSAGLSDSFAKSFASAIESNGLVDNIIDLSDAIRENSSIEQGTNQAMAASILAMNENTKDSSNLSDMSMAGGRIYGQAYDEAYAGYIEDGKTAEEAAALAAADAFNALNAAAADLAEIFSKLSNSGDTVDNAFKDFLASGNLEDISKKDLDEISDLSFRDILSQVKESFTPEELQELGYKSAEQFAVAFKKGLIDAEDMWSGLTDEEIAAKEAEILKNKLTSAAQEHAAAVDLDAEEIELLTEAFADENDGLDDQHQLLGNVTDDQDKLAEAAADAAVRFKQLNNAVNDIADNYEDYSSILNKVANAETLKDKAMAMSEKSFKNLKKSLADVLGVNQDLLKNDFISNVDPDVLNELAEGGETATKAVQKLRNAFIDAQAAEAGLADSKELDDFKSKLADLEDGAVIDINTDPFLMKLIEAKLEAGASATDIEEMLKGMNIDCNVEPFKGAMEELTSSAQNAENATYEAGDAIVGNMSFDAQANDLTVENTDTKEDVGFDETVTATPKVRVNRVLKNKADDATPVVTTVWEYDKTITPKRDKQEEKKSSTVTGVKISNAHKSAGGNVSNTSGRAGGHGGGGSCFVAGTLVSLKDYYKKIEEIQPGDIVLSYNEQTMKNEYSEVLQTMIHNTTEEIYSLFIENEELQATGIHRFLITRNNKQEWIMASNLTKGDLVLFADGTLHKISKIKIKIQTLTVYNFEVSNNHNYYVSKSQILAHNKGGGGGGGGGGKAATRKSATHKHEVHRYSAEENQVKGLSSIYDRLETAKDKAFGADRIRIMEKELAMLKKLRDASADYLGAIVGQGNVDKVVRAVYSGQDVGSMIASGAFGGNVSSDYASLLSGKSASGKDLEYTFKDEAGNEDLVSEAYSLAGLNAAFGSNLGIELDSYGNIKNKDALLNEIQRMYNREMDEYAKFAEPTAAQENAHNKRLAYLEELEERMEQYEETAQMIQEQVDQYLEYIYKAQELNAEKIVHELEVNNTLMEHQLDEIANAIKLLGTKIYRSTEAMNEWFKKNFKERQDAYAQNVEKAQASVEEAMSKWQLWAEDELNPEGIDSTSALSIIDQAKDQVQAAFDDIFAQIEEMKSFFGDTLDYWNDRIQSLTDAMEANADSLDHLQNVLSLLGKGTDYKALGSVIAGAFDVAKDNYAAAKAKSEASSKLYNQVLSEYKSLSGEDAEFFNESTLMPAREQMLEDQANMQSALENVLERMNAWFENEINRIYQEAEDRLVGKWGSFDALDSAMERQHNLADEYLTKTNQLYETNTLLRKLTNDIDKTDTSIAKAKLKAFAEEIEAMKEQNRLSKTDLDIAKARYELLLAQIALEEAQNAKSTVRLQRDNEGNYGYVYTADQDKVNDAEQNFADKQNDLYNLVLGQTQDYTEKIIQLTEERNAALQELAEKYRDGEIASEEEFWQNYDDIVSKYGDLLETSYESYYTAVKWLNEVGAEGQTEAWTNSFSDILYGEEEFSDKIRKDGEDLVTQTADQISWLNDQREFYTEEAKVGNKELKDTVDDITSANKELTRQLTGPGGLISGMESATTAAARLSAEFAAQYTQLLNVAAGYAEIIKQMNAYYATIAAYERQDEGEGNLNGDNQTDYYGAMQEAAKRGLITSTEDELFKTANAWREQKIAYIKENNLGIDYQFEGQDTITNFNKYLQGSKSGYSPYSSLTDEELRKLLTTKGFATGGYTGEWGRQGKLAFLHEKELVLNEDDTKNILDAVSLIRRISSAIDLRAAASSLSSGLNSPSYDGSEGVLEQVVTIHAEFPNAQNHAEIEEAFDNLINRASQYAYRK